jgi:hypothetical protein
MRWGRIILPPLVVFDPVIIVKPEMCDERDPNWLDITDDQASYKCVI